MRRDDVHMTLRPLRLLTVAIAAAGARAAGRRHRQPRVTSRPIAASSSRSAPGRSCCARSTGASSSFAVSPTTRVRLNGARASLADIQPGFVATVVHDGGAPAMLIRAFGKPATRDRPRRRDGTDEVRDHAAHGRRRDRHRRARPEHAIPASSACRPSGSSPGREPSSPSRTQPTAPAKVVNVLKRARA